MSYNVNEKGYYGEFGGAYIPEMLYPNVEELRQNYLKVMAEPEFQKEFNHLLKDYVGRPSPLYFAKRLSEKYNMSSYYFFIMSVLLAICLVPPFLSALISTI